MARYKNKATGETVDAAQWQPGVEHPAVTRDLPPTRGAPGGSAEAGGETVLPGDWFVDGQVVADDAFHDEHELLDATVDGPGTCPMSGDECRGEECHWWSRGIGACVIHVLEYATGGER
ncbi:hypothetical protein LCGC14_3018720 [marine sediment metagenome]|uniref:Uncharacterized protein n=1 Tax=marine sediment metagenome TaxID=412755 RepID=A0A0F8WVX5_9ZZZZ